MTSSPTYEELVDRVRELESEAASHREADKTVRLTKQYVNVAIDSLSSHLAILDESGFILETNDSWQQYGREHEMSAPEDTVGLNYLEICDSAEGDSADVEKAHQVAAGIRAVISGELDEFGTIKYNVTKCIGCKKCEEICPEKAIEFIRECNLPLILQTVAEGLEDKVTKRRLLYETLAKIAIKPPSKAIPVPEGMDEFYNMQYSLKQCAACDKCIEICPEKAVTLLRELDLPAIID